jgi:pilin
MNLRMRWLRLRSPTSTVMLELPICLAIMGVVTVVGVDSTRLIQPRLRVLEAATMAGGATTRMMEYRAESGDWPASSQQAAFATSIPESNPRLKAITIRAGGAVDVSFADKLASLGGKTLSVRAWQGTSADLPVVWRCGSSRSDPLRPSATDQTTLSKDQLPSMCRSQR